MRRVFHFSGGRTSAYMVIHYYQPGDVVIFCDTGKEDERTYKFIHDFEAYENIPVVWLDNITWKELIRKEHMVPNKFKRKCTINFKVKRARRYLRSIGWFGYTQFIGFREDECKRVTEYPRYWEAVTTEFPLYADGVTKNKILAYWKTKPYDLETPAILGNCDLCFLKGKAALMAIMQQYPEKADKWIEEEESDPGGHTFLNGTTYRQLRKKALAQSIQGNLFDMNIVPKFICACTA